MDDSYPSSSITHKASRLPDDTVLFSVFPDFCIPFSPCLPDPATIASLSGQLHSLHLQILNFLSPLTSNYIWQHEPFSLSPSSFETPCFCSSSSSCLIPHLHGKLRYGDNLEDEWFAVFLLFQISRRFRHVSIKVWDTDGEFLLIESAFYLPKWLNPETSTNRVFIRCGNLCVVPNTQYFLTPNLLDSLSFVMNSEEKARASSSVQSVIKNRIGDYPERAARNMHTVRVRVPVLVAQVLKHEPCLISLAVEGFYDRYVDSMKHAEKMEKFLPNKKNEEIVAVSVLMSRAMYGQLVQQTFQAPKCYPMPLRSDASAFVEAELGMKIACGFEMIYQLRKQEGLEGRGRTWEAFRESLERSGYFGEQLPGSKEYKRLMENAEEYYRKSSLHSSASEMISAPVRRIDQILALPVSADDFRGQEIPPSDDDSWLYDGENELNAALMERQKEIDLYNLKHKKEQKPTEQHDSGALSMPNMDACGFGDMAKSMQAFVDKISGYEGAEVPGNTNPDSVDLDVERFMKEIVSVMKLPASKHVGNDIDTEESSSEMDFDESEYESDNAEQADDHEEEQTNFMRSYSDALNEELKTTTLDKSFVRAEEVLYTKDQGASNSTGDAAAGLTPMDVDLNLVKSFLDSFSSQEGLPGPASNLLGLMGLRLPQDAKKGS